jgi:hypothetical protein
MLSCSQAITILMRRGFLDKMVDVWESDGHPPTHHKTISRVTRRFMQKIQSYALAYLWKQHSGLEFTPTIARQMSRQDPNIWEVALRSQKTDLDRSRKFTVDVDVDVVRWVAGKLPCLGDLRGALGIFPASGLNCCLWCRNMGNSHG